MRHSRGALAMLGVRRSLISAASVAALSACTLLFDDLDDYETEEVIDASGSTTAGNGGTGGTVGNGGGGEQGEAGAGVCPVPDETECSADRDLPQCADGRFSRCVGGSYVSYACGESACEDDRCGPSITITDLEDVTIKGRRPQENFEGQDNGTLLVDTFDNETNFNVSVLIKPALGSLDAVPPDLDITLAELRLFQLDRGDEIAVHRIEDDWSEQTVTWNTAPAIAACPLLTVNAEHQDVHLRIDLTETVLDWLANGNARGVRLVPTGDDGNDFVSSEADAVAEHLPALVLFYRASP